MYVVAIIQMIVLATAKIHILKQFTTRDSMLSRLFYCACYCKDTHFEAIHNGNRIGSIVPLIVLATAKIHILKQFTTGFSLDPLNNNCACYCKDTHFEAIHNCCLSSHAYLFIVLATAKIHILKQFTTDVVYTDKVEPLCLLLQRYTF